MKYFNFKRYKFSTVFKNINFKRYNFSKIYKYVDFKRYNFSKIYKYFNFGTYNFNLSKIYKYFNFGTYNFNLSKIYKYFNFGTYKNISTYATGLIIFFILIYLNIPFFFNYDKTKFANIICKGLNIECLIQGKIKYNFLPTPRIKFNDLVIQDFVEENKTIAQIDNVSIKLSLYNLFDKKKFDFTQIELKDAKININLEKLSDYKNFSKKKFKSKPINLKKGEIKFFEGKKNIATISDVNIKYKLSKTDDEVILKGIFLGDKIYINAKNKKDDKNLSKSFVLKLANLRLLTKIDISNVETEKNIYNGKILFKKDKNKITGIFDYKNDKIIIKNANLRNEFLDGKFSGEVAFLPYFDFILNVDLNSINFNRLYSSLVLLSETNKKNLFKVNSKINGKLNLTSNKIFSKNTLINSFESQIKFVNGNILLEQLLLNLGKLGAADMTGIIKNNKKFTNFKFESNIFVDNLKRFYNKFGIYNKKKIPFSLFISGYFDLSNLNIRLDEIYDNKKFKDEDIAYIEQEFNEILLNKGYESLFNYKNLKEFVKLTTSEIN